MTRPYAETADHYWRAGWRGILPLPPRAKKNPPPGYTGAGGIYPSYADVDAWATGPEGEGNIALRMPPGVIGVDVDAYGDKPGLQTLRAAEARLGPLPATWSTTSRDDGVSGIRLYQAPEGLAWPGEIGPATELIQTRHRYAIVSPSIHPETGATYRWRNPHGIVVDEIPTPDQLPALPEPWVAAYTGGELATDTHRVKVEHEDAVKWVVSRPHAAEPMCHRMEQAVEQFHHDLTGSAHNSARDACLRVARLADEGHHGAATAFGSVRVAFIRDAVNPQRSILGKARRSDSDAKYEWSELLASAVGIVIANPGGAKTCDCYGQLTNVITSAQAPRHAAPVFSEDGTEEPAEVVFEPTWRPVDLTPILTGDFTPETPALFPVGDGTRHLLYPGRVHSFHGESESGKSLCAQIEAARLCQAGQAVLYIDFESDAASVVHRLLNLGCTAGQVGDWFTYLRPDNDPRKIAQERDEYAAVLAHRYALAVIDGVTDALGIFGSGSSDLDDVSAFMRQFPRVIAARTGAAVILVDHVTKDADTRGRFAVGSQAKMNALDGAAYVVEVVEPLGQGMRGAVTLRVGKDRPGGVRPHSGPFRKGDRTQESARVVIDSTGPDQLIRADVQAPSRTLDDPQPAEDWRPTGYMERVSEYLQRAVAGVTGGDVENGVRGKNDRIREALSLLIAEGYVRNEGSAKRTSYVSVKPYSETDEAVEKWLGEPEFAPRPEPAPNSPRAGRTESAPAPSPPTGEGRVSGEAGRTESAPNSPLPETVDCNSCGDPFAVAVIRAYRGFCPQCARTRG